MVKILFWVVVGCGGVVLICGVWDILEVTGVIDRYFFYRRGAKGNNER